MGGGLLVLIIVVICGVALKPDQNNVKQSQERMFEIEEYRRGGSRYIGNSYTIEGKVERIESLGENRLIAVSVPGNKQELLPLYLPKSVSSRVNVSRGDDLVFHVVCRTGYSDSADASEVKEVKGVLVVNQVETR